MFTTKQLTAPADLAHYGTLYQEAAHGVSIDPDYLRRVRQVTVLYRTARPDEFLGGYIINADPPLRYFAAPGELARDRSLAPLALREQDLVEIGAIWFGKYRSPLREVHRLLFFVAMIRDALKTDRPFILGGSFIRQIQDFQRQVLPVLIYEDRVTVGGFTGSLQLYVGSRKGVWLRLVRTLAVNVFSRLVNQKSRKQTSERQPPIKVFTTKIG